MENQFWINATSFDNTQCFTMHVDNEDWNWDDEAIKTIVNPLINNEASEIWANGFVYRLA